MGLEENPGYISQEPTLLAIRLHHSPTCDAMKAKLAIKEQTSASKPLFHFSPSVVPAQSRSKNNWWGQSKLAKQTLHDESAPGKPMLGKTWHIVMHGTNSDKTKNQSLRTTQLWKTVPHHPDHMAHKALTPALLKLQSLRPTVEAISFVYSRSWDLSIEIWVVSNPSPDHAKCLGSR